MPWARGKEGCVHQINGHALKEVSRPDSWYLSYTKIGESVGSFFYRPPNRIVSNISYSVPTTTLPPSACI